jgi:hypothetical protein
MNKQGKLNIVLNDNRNVYQNITQDYVIITKDKLELVLLKTEKCLSKKNAWMTPLGLFVSCLLAILSANFKDFIFPANVWHALFIMTTCICFCWFCYTAYVSFRNKKKGNIDDIINKIIPESRKMENY